MDAGLWASVIAVAGTLAGGLLAGGVQLRGARAERREARQESGRHEAVAAVTALVAALADHRRAMWVHEDRRLAGADQPVLDATRTARHETRAAITAPLVTLRLLAPSLSEAAQHAAQATYALRNAADPDVLETLRAAALVASDRLVDEAGAMFAAGTHTSTPASRPRDLTIPKGQ
jgi:hypothetical protein